MFTILKYENCQDTRNVGNIKQIRILKVSLTSTYIGQGEDLEEMKDPLT